MLTIFRRHAAHCPHTSRRERRCSCPVMVEGTLNGEKIRKALGTRNLEAAQKTVREWEIRGSVSEKAPVSVQEAIDRFYADKVAQRLRESSLSKYELLCDELKAEFKGSLASVGIDDLRRYREKWKVAPITGRKKLERLRTFFKFCQESGWVQTNPAKLLTPPKGQSHPVVPFSASELEKILWATEVYPDRPTGRRLQVRGFILLLRYSGLRIGDAVSLKREKIVDGKLFLRTAKTGTSVFLPLPKEVNETLSHVQNHARQFFFWSGNGILKSSVADWQRTLTKLFKLAGVRGHAHQFRHTFSIDLLSQGVPIEDVAVLLGHSSSSITARHYNSFVKSRQQSLEASIQKAWKLG